MLVNTRVSVVGDSFTADRAAKIATFGAVITKGSDEISLTMRILDDDLYEANKSAVTADRTEFETFAFAIQDSVKA